MVVYFAQGRLGNQLFQYSFLKEYANPNEYIISLGFDNLLEVMEKDNYVINIPINRITRYLKICKYIFYLLARIRLITYYRPKKKEILPGYHKEDVQIVKTAGIFGWIKFVKTASYESEEHFPKNIKNLVEIKKSYKLKAKDFLRKIGEGKKVFIHIRLGDYDGYTALGKSVKLPIKYYQKVIDELIMKLNNPKFIFLSNDASAISEMFPNIEHKIVSHNEYGTDFAIMTRCEYGIISASTFSFWGAFLMDNREEVYAPKYWKGFKSSVEYPIEGYPSFAIPVIIK